MKLALWISLGAVLVFGAVTLVALEGQEVVVLRTFDAQGVARETRTWIADYQGAAYIEAANGKRPFLRDIAANSKVELVRDGKTETRRATVLPPASGQALVRALLRQRYGWADRWIGRLTDTSESLGVRLDP